jgi:CheY-like chemotaxis protein
MSSKRALVVDDSKSARAFLSRILERHEISVDTAESAEAAIEYLARSKPDVIFMDHLMPGMDGFQAVQTIKNNPRTSSIPILMYTSQEGDLYLGQARALGAEGVLPKQIKQSDVTRMLFQLRLVSDRRSGERDQTTFSALANAPDLMPANESAIIVESGAAEGRVIDPPDVSAEAPPRTDAVNALKDLLPKLSLEIRAAMDASLQKELATLRGFIGGSLNTHTERLQGDLAALLPAPRTPEVDNPPIIVERSWSKIAGWMLALIALASAGVLGWMWWGRGSEIAALNTDLDAAYAELETLRARRAVAPTPAEITPDSNAVTPAADAPDAAAASSPGVALVPNGGTITSPAAQAPLEVAPAAASPATTAPSTPVPQASAPAPAAPAPAAVNSAPAATVNGAQ